MPNAAFILFKPRLNISFVTNPKNNTEQLKILLTIGLLAIISLRFVSCQTKQTVIIFASAKKDTATGPKDTKIYKLKKKAINSEFDYSKLDDIDGNIKETLDLKNVMPIFEPVSGH
jgi:hypothetical protein